MKKTAALYIQPGTTIGLRRPLPSAEPLRCRGRRRRRGEGEEAQQKALEALRKVAALAVAAMEQNGAPQREGYEKDQEILTCPECSTDLVVDEEGLAVYDEEEDECDGECECECESEEPEEAT